MDLTELNLDELKPNPENPRKITDKKLKALMRSLKEFGDLGGIVINRRTGRLVGGHQRLKVIPKNSTILYEWQAGTEADITQTGTCGEGWIEVPGIGNMAYREVDWDEAKEKAANIAANKGAGDWDWPQLGSWFLDLDAANYDLSLTLFSEGELESALGLKEDKKKDEEPKVKGPREVTCPDCNHQFIL